MSNPPKKLSAQQQNEIVAHFWAAPDNALFTREEIAAVRRCSVAKLDRETWLGTGIKFIRDGGRCLYRKADVAAALEFSDKIG